MQEMTRMALQRPANDGGDARAAIEAAALSLVGARTLERGRRYVAWGAVFDGRRRGAVLRARCEGSGQEAWRVRVTLDPTGVRDAACDCPMGEAGDCKHVAAVLLTFARDPGSFGEVATAEEALAAVDGPGLRALLLRLLLQRPELETLVEEALPAAFARPAAGEGAHDQAAAALRGVWPGADLNALAARLEVLRTEAEGDVRAVERLAVAIVGRRRRVGGDAGPVLAVARRCVDSVARAVAVGEAEERAHGLRWLVGLYGFDIEHGCAGVVEALGRVGVATALTLATADERRALARRVRGAMARGDEWARFAWGAVLVEMEEGLVEDDEAWMAQAREHHRPAARCRRLLALGRTAEASEALAEVADGEVLTLVARFEEAGLREEFTDAVKIRAARAGSMGRERLVGWLRARETHSDDAALGLAEAVLAADPTRAALDDLRARAEALGQWEAVRARAEAVLDAKAPAVLVAWLLDAGDLAAARRVAEDERARPMGFAGPRVAVAEALEAGDPEGAARVYLRQAEDYVAQRGRASYRDACAMLARVERVLATRGREAEARALREGFAARHARLSSLRAELVQHFGPLAA